MRIDIATLFPDMCEAVLSESIVGRARAAGHIEVQCTNIRDYANNKHNRVDDKPYGGGTGMVMQAQPIYDCITDIKNRTNLKSRLIYVSPKGKILTQQLVRELSQCEQLIILCGHYEGVDDRVLEELCAEEISVGDYVLTGGELPALIIADSVARLVPGVLPNSDAYSLDSHYNGLLEHPQYSRPEVWRGRKVPEVLLSGDHDSVLKWQEQAAYETTLKKRPDLLYNRRKNGKPYAKYVRVTAFDNNNTEHEFLPFVLFTLKSRKLTNKDKKDIKRLLPLIESLCKKSANELENCKIYYLSEAAVPILEAFAPIFDIFSSHCINYRMEFCNNPPACIYEDELYYAVPKNE